MGLVCIWFPRLRLSAHCSFLSRKMPVQRAVLMGWPILNLFTTSIYQASYAFRLVCFPNVFISFQGHTSSELARCRWVLYLSRTLSISAILSMGKLYLAPNSKFKAFSYARFVILGYWASLMSENATYSNVISVFSMQDYICVLGLQILRSFVKVPWSFSNSSITSSVAFSSSLWCIYCSVNPSSYSFDSTIVTLLR